MKKTRFQEVLKGIHKLTEEELLRLDLKPAKIPSLPSGNEALTAHTEAGWQTEGQRIVLGLAGSGKPA